MMTTERQHEMVRSDAALRRRWLSGSACACARLPSLRSALTRPWHARRAPFGQPLVGAPQSPFPPCS